MISDFKTSKALYDKLKTYLTAQTLTLVVDGTVNGAQYSPSPTETYITQTFLTNRIISNALADDNSDIQRPIYQITVHTPKQHGQWGCTKIADDINGEFRKPSFIMQDAQQSVQVQSVDKSQFRIGATHGTIVISVNVTVLAR